MSLYPTDPFIIFEPQTSVDRRPLCCWKASIDEAWKLWNGRSGRACCCRRTSKKCVYLACTYYSLFLCPFRPFFIQKVLLQDRGGVWREGSFRVRNSELPQCPDETFARKVIEKLRYQVLSKPLMKTGIKSTPSFSDEIFQDWRYCILLLLFTLKQSVHFFLLPLNLWLIGHECVIFIFIFNLLVHEKFWSGGSVSLQFCRQADKDSSAIFFSMHLRKHWREEEEKLRRNDDCSAVTLIENMFLNQDDISR